jgi:hypothetical protein
MDSSDTARPRRSLEATVIAGFSILAVLMALGMAFSIHRFQSETNVQVSAIRDEEDEITQVERLRWIAEVIVSSGRGYLLAGEPTLLAQVQDSRVEFNRLLDGLRSEDLSQTGRALAQDAERAARRFIRTQQELIDARQASADPGGLVARFEKELLPPSRELDKSLTRLVKYKQRVMQDHYDQAKEGRGQLAQRLYGLLAILVVASIGVAWRFSRRLGLAFGREQEALS